MAVVSFRWDSPCLHSTVTDPTLTHLNQTRCSRWHPSLHNLPAATVASSVAR